MSSIIREMQIKISMKYHSTPVRITKIKQKLKKTNRLYIINDVKQ